MFSSVQHIKKYLWIHTLVETGFGDSLRHLYGEKHFCWLVMKFAYAAGLIAVASATKRTLVLPPLMFLEFNYSKFDQVLEPHHTSNSLAQDRELFQKVHDMCFLVKEDDTKRKMTPFELVFDLGAWSDR